jgi:hypothetical protein
MTRSTKLTHRRAQGDPEFVERVRVILWFDKLTTPRKIEGRRIEG